MAQQCALHHRWHMETILKNKKLIDEALKSQDPLQMNKNLSEIGQKMHEAFVKSGQKAQGMNPKNKHK